jgi:phage protein U
MLYQLGNVQFEVAPVNVHEVAHEVGADFAAKDIVGAARPREFVGESDEPFTLSGKLFPAHFGGLGGLEALESMARSGQPQMFVRGDGTVFGWFLIERVKSKSSFLDRLGVGKMIEFEIELQRSPNAASAGSMLSTLMSLFG